MVLSHCLTDASLVTRRKSRITLRFAKHHLFLAESQIISLHYSIRSPAAWLAYSGLHGCIVVSLAFWATTWNDPSYLGSKATLWGFLTLTHWPGIRECPLSGGSSLDSFKPLATIKIVSWHCTETQGLTPYSSMRLWCGGFLSLGGSHRHRM